MRVLIVSDCYAPRLGGIETQVQDLAHNLRLAGHEPAVVTEIRAGKRASDGGLPVGERVRVRLLSADPASGFSFQIPRP